MRHGPAEALGPFHVDDTKRRLTIEGRRRTRDACAVLARVAPKPARVYTSPLIRARETAGLLADATGAGEPVVTPLLAPGFDRLRLAQELVASRLQPLAVVGHEPDLSSLVGWLLGGDTPPSVVFGKGTVCLTELTTPGRARLLAFYPLDALVRLGDE